MLPHHRVALEAALQQVYEPAGFVMSSPLQPEVEGEEYGACRFGLNGLAIHYRVAKTTPTKIGQFVTLWQRPHPGAEIAPFAEHDPLDVAIVLAAEGGRQGHFIFSKVTLLARGILSGAGREGKRAFRLYPPWSQPQARAAVRSQHWQLQHFLPLDAHGRADPVLTRLRLALP